MFRNPMPVCILWHVALRMSSIPFKISSAGNQIAKGEGEYDRRAHYPPIFVSV